MVVLIKKSENAKLGPIAATYRRVGETCPSSCPLLNAGCYPQGGRIGMTARRRPEWGSWSVDDGPAFEAWARTLPPNTIVRLNVSGDVVTPSGEIDVGFLVGVEEACEARPDLLVYGYTHAWQAFPENFFEKKRFPKNFVLNASCDSPADVKKAIALGWPAVLTVPEKTPRYSRLSDGRTLTVCPYQTARIPCADCQLCMKGDRKAVVAFRPDKSGGKKAREGIAARWTADKEE